MPLSTIQEQKRETIDGSVRDHTEVSIGLLYNLARSGETIPPWWSKTRDNELRDYHKQSDHINGAFWMIGTKLSSVDFRVEPRDTGIKRYVKMADDFNLMLHDFVEWGQGWGEFWSKFFIDLWTQDNGAFGEIIAPGPKDKPRTDLPIGLNHLDGWNCQRTSDPEFPVIYIDASGDGKRYKLHHTRVIYASQMPSAATRMHGVGLCWLSRAINTAQNLIDIGVYKQEKLGSRPHRGVILGKGIGAQQIIDSIRLAEEGMDNLGLRRFAKTPIIANQQKADFDVTLLDLASLPDGFDERTATELGMFAIALAGGFPPRWLWPATTTGATRADSIMQNVTGQQGGAAWHLAMMGNLLSFNEDFSGSGLRAFAPMKFLPPELKINFDFQDDEQDARQAEIKERRAKTREIDLRDGVVDTRTSREQALSDGDITQAQFNRMELKDGRLPDGDKVVTLFVRQDEVIQELLDLGVEDALDVEANNRETMLTAIDEAVKRAADVAQNASTAKRRDAGKQAQAALESLRELYEKEGGGPDEPPPDETGGEMVNQMSDDDELTKDINSYRSGIRSAVRALWNGTFDVIDFSLQMSTVIRQRLRQAWERGAATCGIAASELSPEEQGAMTQFITAQNFYVANFADSIIAGSKANGGKLAPLFGRAETWVNRYNEAFTLGQTMACADRKARWFLGKTEEHCKSCATFDRRVYRFSTWAANGALPQSSNLCCNGFNCDCRLEETDEPMTRGRFPRGALCG